MDTPSTAASRSPPTAAHRYTATQCGSADRMDRGTIAGTESGTTHTDPRRSTCSAAAAGATADGGWAGTASDTTSPVTARSVTLCHSLVNRLCSQQLPLGRGIAVPATARDLRIHGG